jgi:hypothetical protein
VTFASCDRMISHRITVVPSPPAEQPAVDRITALAEESLVSCGAQAAHVTAHRGSLTWRNPEHLPGLTIDVSATGVSLYQHLYGMVGATKAYECVKDALAVRLRSAFGSERITLE